MIDVIIVGAGPAGCIAAIVLARSGARVRLLDRARFPRPKLCGDSLNPGAVALLRRLGLPALPEHRAVLAEGILVTGEGIAIPARYPAHVRGRFVSRTVLDAWLLEQAIDAGAQFDDGVRVTAPVMVDANGESSVGGVHAAGAGRDAQALAARLTIAADGRRSTLAFGLGLARHPRHPRRWAVGAYFEGVAGGSSLGEMHIRRHRYIGVAPLPGGLTNACVVTDDRAAFSGQGDLAAVLAGEIARDPLLGERFGSARRVTPAVMLGPLAVESVAAGMPGLLLAGDAAGFIDPMTGDGMYFAMRGGELAAEAALQALAGRTGAPHRRLAARRRREFAFKRRFNRALRRIVSHPGAVAVGSHLARVYPGSVRRLVQIAGDVHRVDLRTFGPSELRT